MKKDIFSIEFCIIFIILNTHSLKIKTTER
jgi:hypothetical protein